MKKVIIIEIVLLCAVLSANSQDSQYRSGIFLHHSTGGCIWGPNGSQTDVPEQMNFYNIAHGYTGDDAVTLSQTWYPAWNNNEWSTWHSIFDTPFSHLYNRRLFPSRYQQNIYMFWSSCQLKTRPI